MSRSTNSNHRDLCDLVEIQASNIHDFERTLISQFARTGIYDGNSNGNQTTGKASGQKVNQTDRGPGNRTFDHAAA